MFLRYAPLSIRIGRPSETNRKTKKKFQSVFMQSGVKRTRTSRTASTFKLNQRGEKTQRIDLSEEAHRTEAEMRWKLCVFGAVHEFIELVLELFCERVRLRVL